jgi:hypothetical protein
MSGMVVNTCVHLGPGEFETAGFFDGATGPDWKAKSGMRIVGSGIDVTTLKLVNGAASDQRVYAVAARLRTPLVTGVAVQAPSDRPPSPFSPHEFRAAHESPPGICQFFNFGLTPGHGHWPRYSAMQRKTRPTALALRKW